MQNGFKVGDHIQPSNEFRPSYHTLVIVSVNDAGYFVRNSDALDGGRLLRHAEAEHYVKADYPRYGAPVLTGAQQANIVSDVRRALSSRTRKARTLFTPKPFGIGDWVTVYHDGSEHVGQIWADNFVVIPAEAGNIALPIYRRKGEYHVNARTVRRTCNPFEQLALAS